MIDTVLRISSVFMVRSMGKAGMQSNQFVNLRAALGSGATNSAAGHAWVRTFYALKSRPKMNPSAKVFRSGDSRAFQSMGTGL